MLARACVPIALGLRLVRPAWVPAAQVEGQAAWAVWQVLTAEQLAVVRRRLSVRSASVPGELREWLAGAAREEVLSAVFVAVTEEELEGAVEAEEEGALSADR